VRLGEIKNAGIGMNIDKKAEDFIRIHCSTHDAELRIDFVNDVPYRSGATHPASLFPRVDGWWNILSNKITALDGESRRMRLIFFSYAENMSLNGSKFFARLMQKVTFIDPLDVSLMLSEFPKEFFSRFGGRRFFVR